MRARQLNVRATVQIHANLEPISRRTWLIGLLICTAIAAGLRIPAALTTDFALDEIYSWQLMSAVESPVEVFTKIRVDNNHWLNTLFMQALGQQPQWWRYRLLSLVCGIASVPMTGLVLRRRFGYEASLIAAAMAAVCFILVEYSTEARGYAPCACAALAAALIVDRMTDRTIPIGRARLVALVFAFWVVCALGFLSHQIFLFAFVGLLAWLAAELKWDRANRRSSGALWLICASLPSALFAALYWWIIRHQITPGIEGHDIPSGLRQFFEYTFGATGHTPIIVLAAVVAVTMFVWQCVRLIRKDQRIWVMFVVACVVAPTVTLIVLRPRFFYARYLFVVVPFLLMAIALAIRELRVRWKWGALGYFVLFAAGNIWQVSQFQIDGHGHAYECLRFIADVTPGPLARIAADGGEIAAQHIPFYSQYLPEGEHIECVPPERFQETPPQWLLVFSTEEVPFEPDPARTLDGVNAVYRYVRTFRYFGLTGWNLHVYAALQ